MVRVEVRHLDNGEIENKVDMNGDGYHILIESVSLILALLDSIKTESEEIWNDVLEATLKILLDQMQGKVIPHRVENLAKSRWN